MVQEVTPTMRKQCSGIIVNVSSYAGRIGFPVSSAYVSSKFALEGLSEALRLEIAPFGINVIIIEPGVTDTNFFKPSKISKKSKSDTVYRNITDKIIAGVKRKVKSSPQPKEVAIVILNAIKDKTPLPRYHVGDDAAEFLDAKKSKSDIQFENYLKRYYAFADIMYARSSIRKNQ